FYCRNTRFDYIRHNFFILGIFYNIIIHQFGRIDIMLPLVTIDNSVYRSIKSNDTINSANIIRLKMKKEMISTNPAKGYEEVGRMNMSTEAEVKLAVQKAHKAFPGWRSL